VICARAEDELQRARHALATDGIDVFAVRCDVSSKDDVDATIADVIQRFGRIDLLINNAGIIQVAPLDALGLDDFRQAMDINFWGVVNTTLAVLPHMRRQRGGRIVNVTSIGGKVAVPHLLPYDCAKFAAVGFSQGLGAELARDGISVTTVVPGLMRTGSHAFAHYKGRESSERRWFSMAARAPLLTIGAPRAARRIVRAAMRRQAEAVIGMPAKMLRMMNDLFPGLVVRGLAITNRLLPAPPSPS
jgi:NAD(P)-dependent dehydrogenase (short-subunit alcohol dehydrogenase family)